MAIILPSGRAAYKHAGMLPGNFTATVYSRHVSMHRKKACGLYSINISRHTPLGFPAMLDSYVAHGVVKHSNNHCVTLVPWVTSTAAHAPPCWGQYADTRPHTTMICRQVITTRNLRLLPALHTELVDSLCTCTCTGCSVHFQARQ